MKKLVLILLLSVFHICYPQTKHIDIPLKSNIIWLGETHGTTKTNILAFDFIKNIDEQLNLDYLLIEGSFYSEILLNKYLDDGKESSLNKLMMNYEGTIGYTIQKKEYFKKIFDYTRTSKKTVRAISIDIEHSTYKTNNYIYEKYRSILGIKHNLVIDKFKKDFSYKERRKFYIELHEDIKLNTVKYQTLFKKEFKDFQYIVRNIVYSGVAYSSKNWDKVRDSLIYENFKLRDSQFEFSKHTTFAYWGAGHTNQSATKDGIKWIASRIKDGYPSINQITFSTLYANCSFIFQEHNLPGILRWMFPKEKEGFRISKSLLNNNTIIQKVKGIKYLIRNSNSEVEIFDVQELPKNKKFVYGKEKDILNSDYIQYVVLIQNSKECNTLYP